MATEEAGHKARQGSTVQEWYKITQNHAEPGKRKNSRKERREKEKDYIYKGIQKFMVKGIKKQKKETGREKRKNICIKE